jgi:hypothetical protein
MLIISEKNQPYFSELKVSVGVHAALSKPGMFEGRHRGKCKAGTAHTYMSVGAHAIMCLFLTTLSTTINYHRTLTLAGSSLRDKQKY